MFPWNYTFVYSLQIHSFSFVQLVHIFHSCIAILCAFYLFFAYIFVLISFRKKIYETRPSLRLPSGLPGKGKNFYPPVMKNPKTLENPHFLCKIEKTAL